MNREGHDEPLEIVSGFTVPDTDWHERSGLRQVGIQEKMALIVYTVAPNSPAEDAGLKPGDTVTHADGNEIFSWLAFRTHMQEKEWKTMKITVLSPDGSTREVDITPEKPTHPANADPQIGVMWDARSGIDTRIVNPGPLEQVGNSVEMMWVTITNLVNPKSEVNVSHLSGPAGIGNLMYQFLQMEDGWRRILAFMVLFNVNLAVLNMLPMPVLDGGHIVLATLEKIFGRPVGTKQLEIIQTVCALALISLMLFVTSKDVPEMFGGGGDKQETVFPD